VSVRRSVLWGRRQGKQASAKAERDLQTLAWQARRNVRAESDSQLGARDLLVVLRDELADCGD
jgi:hypothetical protein